MSDERPAPSDVESYLNDIQTGGWSVKDYSATYGSEQPVTVTVELEWSKPLPNGYNDIKQIIRGIEGQFDEGAPVEAVLDSATTELGISPKNAQGIIESLKERGEIYQPNEDHLRVI